LKLKPVCKPRDTRVFILEQAISLFAMQGFHGVSMRKISKATSLSTAALYHHFPDKETLYLGVIKHAFAEKSEGIMRALDLEGTPIEKLDRFILRFTMMMGDDPNFRSLVQWELLDDDESRLKQVTEEVFSEPFKAIKNLSKELCFDCDSHMLATSIVGLIMFHFEAKPVHRYLDGGKAMHSDPQNIARHVSKLLTNTLTV